MTASPIAAVGGIPASTHWGTGTVLQPFTLAQEDPFKDVPIPPYDPEQLLELPEQSSQRRRPGHDREPDTGVGLLQRATMDLKGDRHARLRRSMSSTVRT